MRRSYGKVSSGGFPEPEQGAFPTSSSSSSPKKSTPSSPKNKFSCALQALQCSSRAGGDAPSTIEKQEQDNEGFNHFYPYHLRSEGNETLYGGKSEWKATTATTTKATNATNAGEEPTTSSTIGDDDDDNDDDGLADFLAAPLPSPSEETNTRQQQQDCPNTTYTYTSAVSKTTTTSASFDTIPQSTSDTMPQSTFDTIPQSTSDNIPQSRRQRHTHTDTDPPEDGINVGPSQDRMAREQQQLMFPTESIDEIPKEELQYSSSEEPGEDRPQTPSHQYGSPRQLFSEDTHDTPIQSNVQQQQQTPGGSTCTTNKRAPVPQVKLDALCSNYFNTPHKKGVNSTAPLGDSITPDTSPVVEENEDEARSTLDISPEHKEWLQQLADSFIATKLEEMPRLDHPSRTISDEKKVPDPDDAIQLTPDNASVSIGGQEVKASREVNHVKLTKRYSETSGLVSLKADSSVSSVSSFAHATLQPRTGRSQLAHPQEAERASAGSMLTPHPFFWRSHPNVTVTSYQPQPTIHQVVPELKSVPTMQATMNILDNNYSGSEHIPHNMTSPARSGSQKVGKDYGPAAVRKLWLESEPFRLQVNSKWQPPNIGSTSHPHGPPSTRSRQPAPQKRWGSFGKIPAVFSRSDGNIKSNVTGCCTP